MSNKIRINERVILDKESDEIFINNEVYKLTPKHFKVLLYLIKKNNQLVTRDELFETIWQDTIVVDESLTRAISEIRKIIEENPKDAKIIQTIPKKGYRFSAIIEEYTANNSQVLSNYKTMGITLLTLIFIAFFYLNREINYKIELSGDILPVTSYDGLEIDGTISPDAKEVLFISKGSTKFKEGLYLKKLATEELIFIDSSNVQNPVFSKNRDVVIYIKNKQEIVESSKWGKHKKVLLKDDSSSIYDFSFAKNCIVYLTKEANRSHIKLLDLNTFKLKKIYETTSMLSSPILLNDLKQMYFLEEKNKIFYLQKIDLGNLSIKSVLLNINQVSDMAIYLNNLIISASNRIFDFDLNTYSLKRLKFLQANIKKISIANNGNLLINQEHEVLNIWQYDLLNNSDRKRIQSALNDYSPLLSKNDPGLFFISNRCGNQNFWKSVSEDEEDRPLTKYVNGQIISYVTSDDGNFIYFIREEHSKRNIYKLNTVTKKIDQITNTHHLKIEVFFKDSILYFIAIEDKRSKLFRIDSKRNISEISEIGSLIQSFQFYENKLYVVFEDNSKELQILTIDGANHRTIQYKKDIYDISSNNSNLFISFLKNERSQGIYQFSSKKLEFLITIPSKYHFVIDESISNLYFSKNQNLLNSDIFISKLMLRKI